MNPISPSNPTKTEAISRFLNAFTHKDLADLYNINMECQVNVAPDGGELVPGEYKGKKYQAYTDGIQTWKPIRIPYNASSSPEYFDSELNFNLVEHCEAIGMTGWDWVKKYSRWVAFDFDSIIGHSDKHTKKLAPDEISKIEKFAMNIPWVQIRKSTSGKGLHMYVFLKLPSEEHDSINNHNEHAAVGRAVLGQMSALVGYDFNAKVDNCGGNMWVWHRKMKGTDGLTIIKPHSESLAIPTNWKDHLKVVTGQRKKNLPSFLPKNDDDSLSESERMFQELSGQTVHQPLDEEHKKLIEVLKDREFHWWWDSDNHMLVTHTTHLKEIHKILGLRGIFDTESSHSSPQNCFCFPLRKGAWAVRRYTPGIKEHESWEQDGQGWTRCYLNRDPDLASVARAKGGVEHPTSGWVFRDAKSALEAIEPLGITLAKELPLALITRQTKVKQHRDGNRIVIEIEHNNNDDANSMPGWLLDKKAWKKVLNPKTVLGSEPEIPNYDDSLRHLVTESGEDSGWVIRSDSQWRMEPLAHVRVALESQGQEPKDQKLILGSAVIRPWTLVSQPFQVEYPGDRLWNRKSAQLRFLPKEDTESLSYPNWMKILNHIGEGLNDAIKINPWCKVNGIQTGADYLKLWIASIFQYPFEPLPYLFIWSPEQSTGKSVFHEALNLLIIHGVMRADFALLSQQGFNAELIGVVLCVVEETDLRQNKTSYARIKDWVTSLQLPVHEKGGTPYTIRNTTHWVHCDNNFEHCPLFPGDTRITSIRVEPLDVIDKIPKRDFIPLLEKEAPDFVAELLKLEIPASNDRLFVPVIETEDKKAIQALNRSPLELFIEENCFEVPGELIKFSDFYDMFMSKLQPHEQLTRSWSKVAVGRLLPPKFIKGRLSDSQWYIGNMSWHPQDVNNPPKSKYYLQGQALVQLVGPEEVANG